jgi:hypothetical protein
MEFQANTSWLGLKSGQVKVENKTKPLNLPDSTAAQFALGPH